jgi:hypothetical protein
MRGQGLFSLGYCVANHKVFVVFSTFIGDAVANNMATVVYSTFFAKAKIWL